MFFVHRYAQKRVLNLLVCHLLINTNSLFKKQMVVQVDYDFISDFLIWHLHYKVEVTYMVGDCSPCVLVNRLYLISVEMRE